jgi:hypothetical protein
MSYASPTLFSPTSLAPASTLPPAYRQWFPFARTRRRREASSVSISSRCPPNWPQYFNVVLPARFHHRLMAGKLPVGHHRRRQRHGHQIPFFQGWATSPGETGLLAGPG